MHVMDDIHGVDVNAGQPVHHLHEPVEHVVEVQVLSFNGSESRADLRARDLVPPSIDCVQKTLRKIGSRAEELHLFAKQHWGNTARYGAVIPPSAAHDLVAFKLNGAAIDGNFGGETPESIRQPWRIPN